MKNLERVTVIVFVAVLAVFIGVKAYTRMAVDTTPPQISCDTDTIDISVADPESVLLQGVTAKDDRDGDLTGSIMVKGVTNLLSGNTARVSYIVFDSSNNMATCQRTIRYTDYEKPRFALSQPHEPSGDHQQRQKAAGGTERVSGLYRSGSGLQFRQLCLLREGQLRRGL